MATSTRWPAPVQLASSETPERWHELRGEGVTASIVHAIASGGRGTWRRILTDQLNGSTFRGNRHTKRGREREAFIVAHLTREYDLQPNSILWAHGEQPLHRATPDALRIVDGSVVGGEVKSRAYGYTGTMIPVDHYDQCLWGMHVTGAHAWVYAWEVMGPDGEPTLDDPHEIWISRDEPGVEERIDQLVRIADEYLAWRQAGAPERDDLTDEQDDLLTDWAAAKEATKAAKAREAELEQRVRALIEERPTAEDGDRLMGTVAGYRYAVTSKAELDETAWETADPEEFSRYRDMTTALTTWKAEALARYARTVRSTRLTVEVAK